LIAHIATTAPAALPTGVHAERGEQEGQQAADEHADDDLRVGQVEGHRHAWQVSLQIFHIRTKENHRGQTGRGDRIALGHSLHGVADGIQFIGDLAHAFRQAGHGGEATRIVGDWAEGIQRDDDAGHAEHGDDRDGDAVEAVPFISDPRCWRR